MVGETDRAEPTEGTGVGGEKHDRVRGAHGLARRRLCIRPRELDERGRAARVVVRAGPRPGVVAVREHDDRVVRLPGRDGPQVAQRHAAEAVHVLLPHVLRHGQPVRCDLVLEPLRGERRLRAAGRAVRQLGQVDGERFRRRTVEARRQLRRGEHRRPHDAEREDEQRNRQHEERAAVQPAVDRTLERAATRTAAPCRGPGRRHDRAILAGGPT